MFFFLIIYSSKNFASFRPPSTNSGNKIIRWSSCHGGQVEASPPSDPNVGFEFNRMIKDFSIRKIYAYYTNTLKW